MKSKPVVRFNRPTIGKLIVRFGQARLIRHRDGTYNLCGGSVSDHTDVKQWISLFEHDIVVDTCTNRIEFPLRSGMSGIKLRR